VFCIVSIKKIWWNIEKKGKNNNKNKKIKKVNNDLIIIDINIKNTFLFNIFDKTFKN